MSWHSKNTGMGHSCFDVDSSVYIYIHYIIYVCSIYGSSLDDVNDVKSNFGVVPWAEMQWFCSEKIRASVAIFQILIVMSFCMEGIAQQTDNHSLKAMCLHLFVFWAHIIKHFHVAWSFLVAQICSAHPFKVFSHPQARCRDFICQNDTGRLQRFHWDGWKSHIVYLLKVSPGDARHGGYHQLRLRWHHCGSLVG